MRIGAAFVLGAMLWGPASQARVGFWGICKELLGLNTSPRTRFAPARELEIRNQLQQAAGRLNRQSSQWLEITFRPREELASGEKTIAMEPRLKDDLEWIRRPTMVVLVNPAAPDLDWSEGGLEVGRHRGLVGLIGNFVVNTPSGPRSSIELVLEEVERVQAANPLIRVDFRSVPAKDFSNMEFSYRFSDHTAFWIEGDVLNFQDERILGMALLNLAENMAKDSSFVRGSTSKSPSRLPR